MFNKISTLLLAVCVSTAAVAQGDIQLSLSETLKIAVERNLDIQLQRMNINTSNISLEGTRAVYEPTVTGSLAYSEDQSLPSDADQGEEPFERVSYSWNGSFDKREYWGFSWGLDLDNSKTSSNAANGLGTTYNNSFQVRFSQELLKGFALDGLGLDEEVLKYDEFVARHDLNLTAFDLESRINGVIQSAENAYWDLVYARENLEVSKASLKLAQELYKQNETKVKVGTLAPIELVNDESEIASREQSLITSENQLLAAEDALRKILNMVPEDWSKRLVPTERLKITPVKADFEKDLQVAVSNRVEMKRNRGEMAKAELSLKKSENDLLPNLTLSGGYGQSGQSRGGRITGVDPTTGEIVDTGRTGPTYRDAIENMLDGLGNGLNARLQMSWKPFNKAAKLDRARARVGIRQQELNLASTRLDIMESLASAIRDLNANLKAINAAEKTVKLRMENLKAEEQKFQNGLSTNYFVTEKQNQLASAETSLIQTKINYLKAVTSYYSALGKLVENRGIRVE